MLNKQKNAGDSYRTEYHIFEDVLDLCADFGDTPESQINHNTNRAYPTL